MIGARDLFEIKYFYAGDDGTGDAKDEVLFLFLM